MSLNIPLQAHEHFRAAAGTLCRLASAPLYSPSMSRQERPSSRPPNPLLVFAWVAAVVGLASLWRRLPVDDAYITFRYAQNLASGTGLVFNPGELVLGTTSPLWAIVLAVCSVVGLNIEWTALVLGALCFAACAALFFVLLTRDLKGWQWLVWGAAIALYYPLSIVTFSGMETAAYSLAVAAGLFQLSRGRAISGAALGAAATLLRPDGALVIIAGTIASAQLSGRARLKALAAYVAILVPFLQESFSAYGAILPHSVEAKRLLYAVPVWKNALFFLEALSQEPIDAALLCCGAAGLFFAARHRDLRPFALWGALYGGGIVASGIKPIFFWYFGPLWLLFLTVGVEGLRRQLLASSRELPSRPAPALAAAALCAVSIDIVKRAPGLDAAEAREAAYREALPALQKSIAPADTVLMSEIGILGAGLPEVKVLDAAGLVSPGISEIIREEEQKRGGSFEIGEGCAWLPAILERYQPEWILGVRDQLGISKEPGRPKAAAQYEVVAEWQPQVFGGLVLLKRAPSAQQ